MDYFQPIDYKHKPNVGQVEMPENGLVQANVSQNQGLQHDPVPNREEVEYVIQANPRPMMVHRNQDADKVLQNVQQNNFLRHNNITSMVEQILAQSGLNVDFHRPNFISPLSKYV